MIGEYHEADEQQAKFYTDYETKSLLSNKEKYGQEHRLNDDDLSISSIGSTEHNKRAFQKRQQHASAIGTDSSGAAVRTINNILNGITNSVNRLSELHIQISDTPRSRVASAQISPNQYRSEVNPLLSGGAQMPLSDHRKQMGQIEPGNVHLSTSSSKSIAVGKSRNIRKRFRDPKLVKRQGSAQIIKKSVKVDKKLKIKPTLEEGSLISSSRMVPFSKGNNKAKLVEIFHNKEAKSSDSDDGHAKSKHVNSEGDHFINEKIHLDADVPELQLTNCETGNDLRVQSKRPPPKIITDEFYDPLDAPRALIDCFEKSYQLPTIASRMKQVAKNYLNTFSFKTMANTIVGVHNGTSGPMIRTKKAIPFCPAISTSPSHNIGINIQQVMNILKNRQPINGISPTLAHNIGLAAERLNSRPLSTLVSTINSKTCYVRPQACPLSKCNLNYQQLQDLAKSIPEETQEEVDGEGGDSPEVKTIIITGPSGDMEVKSKNLPMWGVDSSKSTECTCIPQTGTDLHYVANKYRRPGKGITSQMSISNVHPYSQRQTVVTNMWNPKVSKRPHTVTKPKEVPVPKVEKIIEKQLGKAESENPLIGKEKNLKEVLTNLHDEFEQLNKRYEELSQNAVPADEGVAKEMERLEEELNKKEEEITMVMTLCKEVMALKNQIKSLKKISSQCSVSQEPKDSTTSANFNDYNNPQAAFHLTKLLKQIQTYQMRYKNGVGV